MSTPAFKPGFLYEGFLNNLKKKGLARPNDFYVKIDINENIAKIPFQVPDRFTSEDKRQISFMCKNASFPKLEITTQDFIEKPSRIRKIAHKRQESQVLPLTFYCSVDFWERKFFEKWMNYVVDPKTYTPNYYDEYAKYNTMTIFSLPKTFSANFVFDQQIDYRSLREMQTAFNGSPSGGGFSTDSSSLNINEFFKNLLTRGAGSGKPFYYVKFFECYPVSLGEIQLDTSSTNVVEFTVEISYKYFQSISDVNVSELKTDVY